MILNLGKCHLMSIGKNTHEDGFNYDNPNESRTVNYGLETVIEHFFLWANLPPEYKLANSLNIFRRKIKNCIGDNCPCRLRKTYVRELSYI